MELKEIIFLAVMAFIGGIIGRSIGRKRNTKDELKWVWGGAVVMVVVIFILVLITEIYMYGGLTGCC